MSRKPRTLLYDLILLLLTGLSVALLLKYDKEKYYFGSGCQFCNEDIPFEVRPIQYAEHPRGIVLADADDYILIGPPYTFKDTGILIDIIVAYGYSDTSIVVKCKDHSKRVKFFVSQKTNQQTAAGFPQIRFVAVRDESLQEEFMKGETKNYTWIYINGDYPSTVSTLFSIFLVSTLALSTSFVKRLASARLNKA